MVRVLAVVLGAIFVIVAVAFVGLLTNWFRYRLSLEASLVVAAVLGCVLLVVGISYVAYARNSARFLQFDVLAIAVSIGLVVYVQTSTMGGLPALRANHIEKSPSEVIQTSRGTLTYWIELEN